MRAGVDGSARIADVAERLVAANRLAESQGAPIIIVQGRLEQLTELPVQQVAFVLAKVLHCDSVLTRLTENRMQSIADSRGLWTV